MKMKGRYNNMEDLISAIKLGEVLGKNKKSEKTWKIIGIVVAVIGAAAVIAAIVYGVVRYVSDHLDYYEDDFDDLFEDEDEEEEDEMPGASEDDFVEE